MIGGCFGTNRLTTFPEKLMANFDKWDTDGDHTIDRSEMMKACQELGLELTEEELAHYLAKFDTNFDGALDIQEFAEFVKLTKEARDQVYGLGVDANHRQMLLLESQLEGREKKQTAAPTRNGHTKPHDRSAPVWHEYSKPATARPKTDAVKTAREQLQSKLSRAKASGRPKQAGSREEYFRSCYGGMGQFDEVRCSAQTRKMLTLLCRCAAVQPCSCAAVQCFTAERFVC